jgi:hypothetical protein
MDAVCNQDNKKLDAMLAARDEEPRARKRISFLAALRDSAGIKATGERPDRRRMPPWRMVAAMTAIQRRV